MKRFILALAAWISAAAAVSADPYAIAVIPKGSTHEFWKAMHAGALKAADE